jgi:hypothetical protein
MKRQEIRDRLEATGTHELAQLAGGVRLSRGRPSSDLRQTLTDLVLEEIRAGRVGIRRATGEIYRRPQS